MNGLKILIAMTCLTFTAVISADQFLCVADQAAGFMYSKTIKKWQASAGDSDEKYVISESDLEGYAYQLKEVGEETSYTECKEDFTKFGYLTCEGLYEFQMNRDNGRFLMVFKTGYFNVLPEINDFTDETSDTPYMVIGKCSPF